MLKKTDISKISMEELMDDLMESMEYLETCQNALMLGVFNYKGSNESVSSRFIQTLRQQSTITGEMSKRLGEFVSQLESIEPEERDSYLQGVLLNRGSNTHVQLVLLEV